MKPWIAAMILIIAYAVDIVVVGEFTGKSFKTMLATMIPELLLVVIAAVVILAFKENIKEAFPVKKPKFLKIIGTILIWAGVFLGTMLVTILLSYFFPRQVFSINDNIESMIGGLSLPIALLIVAVTPAVCEELAFRGGLYYFVKNQGSKWMGILVTAIIFGIFHGSIWRLIPTAILGTAMGYLLFESENMCYNMLFHFINNAVPVLLMYMPRTEYAAVPELNFIPMSAVGSFMIYSAAAPFLVYAGNYFFHKGEESYKNRMTVKERKVVLKCMGIVSAFLVIVGLILVVVDFIKIF